MESSVFGKGNCEATQRVTKHAPEEWAFNESRTPTTCDELMRAGLKYSFRSHSQDGCRPTSKSAELKHDVLFSRKIRTPMLQIG